MPKIPGPKVRDMVIRAMAIKAMVMVMVMVMVRPVVWPMLWMFMSIRGIRLISLKWINKAIWSSCPLG